MYGNKIKSAEERKAIRDQAIENYHKQLLKVKKMREENSSDPVAQSKLKVEEETARSMQLHLESSSKHLSDEINTIIKDKH